MADVRLTGQRVRAEDVGELELGDLRDATVAAEDEARLRGLRTLPIAQALRDCQPSESNG